MGGAFDDGIVEEAVEQDGDARARLSFAPRRRGRETDLLFAAHVYKRPRVGWRFNNEAR
jgi:succinate dehydrogenase flavin-adding protein (antitoxin of CptAB toxin-antitoxin module)